MTKAEGITGSAEVGEVSVKAGGGTSWADEARIFPRFWESVIDSQGVKDAEDARNRALGDLQNASMEWQRAEVRCEGDHRIRPGMRVTLKYVGDRFSGEYVAERVEHEFGIDGFITEVHLRRNMLPGEPKRPSAIDEERERQHNGGDAAKESSQEDTEEQETTEENHDSLINKSDEIEKNRENRLSQNSLRPKKPNGPCYFRSLVACVEEKLNENFTLMELQEIARSAASDRFIGNSEEYYFVNNPKEVIRIALEKKGYKNSTITYKNRSNNCSGTSDFTIRYISSKGHFQLGDSKGNLLWEPYKYNNPANSFSGTASKYNEVSIILGVKE